MGRWVSKLFGNQRGQTMVDLVVSMALLSSAVASAGLLSTTSARVNTEAGRRSQATALADRELEAVRDFRLASEKTGTTWDTMWPGFSGTGCTSFYMQRSGDNWNPIPAGVLTPYTSANAGETDPKFDNEYSNFSRLITMCDGSGIHSGLSNAVEVTVTEQWGESNGQRKVQERTVLTDWNQ